MDPQLQPTINDIVGVLRDSRSILFVTGAGISADSGVPTYRGIGGLYDVEVTEEGLPIEQILSGSTFRSDPELSWKYLGQIAEAARGAKFNRAHEVIAEMERHFPRVWTLTQNVDGFHRLAGSQNVIEIHGNMRSLSCTQCSYRMTVEQESSLDMPPRCPDCHAILRPDVVLFGELLPDEAVDLFWREVNNGFDVVFSVGTSSLFPYIQQPVVMAGELGIPTIEINPTETVLSACVDYRLPLGAATALDKIWKQFLVS